ncbi:MAG TPA: glycosyltransferase family 1 protein [Chitinophagales bacterium]|nr:glycosyltransferase family 1 protein [Chitinophagales bacterium]
MKIGVWVPQRYDTSVKIYSDNICTILQELGVEIHYFGKNQPIPDVDLIWDPTCTGARYPNRKILTTSIPWIVTLHGAANLSMPLRYTYPKLKNRFFGVFTNLRRRIMWGLYKFKVKHIITVSKFAKEELVEQLNIYPDLITYIYHGYDDNLFYPQSGSKEFYLHVSIYQPKKNTERIVEAYNLIKNKTNYPLLLVCPGYPDKIEDEKITLIRDKQTPKSVAKLMKNAYCFIFPSLHESFGLPLVESMASGAPLITSDSSACKEICKDGGITVNPYQTEAISNAILMIEDVALHEKYTKAALERAKDFSWRKSALLHLELFKRYQYE